MKLKILDLEGKEKGNLELPKQFNEELRPILIKRAVQKLQSQRHSYGAHTRAGLRHSAELSRRRRKYRGSYGLGISRVPRKILSRSGTRFNWAGAVAPGTVGGRRAHAPKASKIWLKKINKKENRKAIRSAISSTIMPEIVKKNGFRLPTNYPFIIDSSVESLKKTKEVKNTLEKMGFSDELKRTEKRKIRAGKGKMRNRKYKSKTGVLFVVSKDCDLMKSANNLPGVSIMPVNALNAEVLSSGVNAGRATLFTKDAVELMKKEKLYL